jgi:hypothetical protein
MKVRATTQRYVCIQIEMSEEEANRFVKGNSDPSDELTQEAYDILHEVREHIKTELYPSDNHVAG